MFIPFSKGRCFACGERLRLIDTIKSGSGIEYQFECGHVIIVTGLPEVKNGSHGHSYSRVGTNKEGIHDVHIRRRGTNTGKDEDEITVAKTFSHNFFPEFTNFEKDIQSSSVDVIAQSDKGHEVELFQITKLSDETFWAELSRNNQVTKVMPEITLLVEKAIQKKLKYESKDRKKIILLIDARPGVMKCIADEIKTKLTSLAETAGFKQIWLVGSIKNLTHQIY